MGRYRHYPRWMLLVRAGILLTALPFMFYFQVCGLLALHYRAKMDHFHGIGLSISGGWIAEPDTFTPESICISERYMMAGSAAIDHDTFDLVWMVRNWDTDFLALQPPCSARTK